MLLHCGKSLPGAVVRALLAPCLDASLHSPSPLRFAACHRRRRHVYSTSSSQVSEQVCIRVRPHAQRGAGPAARGTGGLRCASPCKHTCDARTTKQTPGKTNRGARRKAKGHRRAQEMRARTHTHLSFSRAVSSFHFRPAATLCSHNPNSKKSQVIAGIPNVGLCQHCHDIIEWRKKFRKYKPIKNLTKWLADAAHNTARTAERPARIGRVRVALRPRVRREKRVRNSNRRSEGRDCCRCKANARNSEQCERATPNRPHENHAIRSRSHSSSLCVLFLALPVRAAARRKFVRLIICGARIARAERTFARSACRTRTLYKRKGNTALLHAQRGGIASERWLTRAMRNPLLSRFLSLRPVMPPR